MTKTVTPTGNRILKLINLLRRLDRKQAVGIINNKLIYAHLIKKGRKWLDVHLNLI